MAPKRRETSVGLRELIVKCHKEGNSQYKIAQIFGIPRGTVQSILRKFKQHGVIENRPGRGRKCLFTKRNENKLSRTVKQNRRKSLQEITTMVNEVSDHSFCTKTVQRKLSDMGFKRRVVKKKVLVRAINKKKRILWCRERRHWTVEEQWCKWIFSDESQVVIGSDNRMYIWRKDDEVNKPHLVCPTHQRRLSVMIWGCVSFHGIGTFTPVIGNIDSRKYIDILDEHLWPVLARHFPNDDYIFMDDNAPVHRARNVKTFKENNNIHDTEWPAQSPDLNLIENIWLHLKRTLQHQSLNLTTQEDLVNAIRQAWENIPVQLVRSLYETIPARLQEVIRMKGNLTKF